MEGRELQLGNPLPCGPGEKFSLPDLLKLSAIFIDFLRPRFSGRFSVLSSVNVPKAGEPEFAVRLADQTGPCW
jgi:hypothetical protein